jgi:hypothetical protein
MSYDNILKDIELAILIDKVDDILNQLHSKMTELSIKYSTYPEMLQSLKDVDIYLTAENC